MIPSINYRSLVQDLKTRFSGAGRDDPAAQLVGNQMCRRMMTFLEMDRDVPLEEMIDRLEAKWRADGLIATEDD